MLDRVLVLLLLAVASTQAAHAEEALPAGLLDFLGSMVESDGELVDPLSLESPVDGILAGSDAEAGGDDVSSTNAKRARGDAEVEVVEHE